MVKCFLSIDIHTSKQLGIQYGAQGHFGMQIGSAPQTYQLVGDLHYLLSYS